MTLAAESLKSREARQICFPEICILPDETAVDHWVANTFISQTQKKVNSVFTLPTGNTQLAWYEIACNAYKELGLDFSHITTRNLDEYWPLKKSSPDSYASYMNQNFFDKVNIPECQRFIPNCEAPNRDEEAKRYEMVVRSQMSDLTILGLGPEDTCHIGFNEKGTLLDSVTHYGLLDDKTKKANRRVFKESDFPDGAITQGISTILDTSKKIVIVVKGEAKAWGVLRSLYGDINPDAPASFLRLHPHVTWVMDEPAAKLIRQFNEGNLPLEEFIKTIKA